MSAQNRMALARRVFELPSSNIYRLRASKTDVDSNVVIPAGQYHHFNEETNEADTYKYNRLVGRRYLKNMDVVDWNMWKLKHQSNPDKYAEPTEAEKHTGQYEANTQNIYTSKVIWKSEIYNEPAKTNMLDYNGIVIVSTHGDLNGHLYVGGRTLNGRYLGELLMEKLPRAPDYVIVLACGVGQNRDFAQELADITMAQVFASKFVVGRPGVKLQWDVGAHGLGTDWSLQAHYEGGIQVPFLVVLGNQLWKEFTEH